MLSLEAFQVANPCFQGQGPLSVVLLMTDLARTLGLPLKPEMLVTKKRGQVSKLGPVRVQKILARHGITRVLSAMAGRTSRGSLANMQVYVAWLNAQESPLDLDAVEGFWIAQVRAFFDQIPLELHLDESLGLRTVLRRLFAQARARQRGQPGATFLGTLLQHLVGAKLDLVLGSDVVTHHGSNQNDAGHGRHGDFDVGDVSIHVSSAPGEALVRRCQDNLDAGRRPLIVTVPAKVLMVEGLAEQAGIADRLDVLEVEQFVATTLYERAFFRADLRRVQVRTLVDRYNVLVDTYETDPSLRIEVPGKKGKS